MEYVLINAAKMHEERPELLEVLPIKEELDSVDVNDYVRLIFSHGGGHPTDVGKDRHPRRRWCARHPSRRAGARHAVRDWRHD